MALKANLLVGQSGGCTAVINQTLCGIIETAQSARQIGKVYGMRHGVEGILRNEIIDLTAVAKKTLTLLGNTPSSALGSCRYKINEMECERILDYVEQQNIRYFLLIGGNDTAQTSAKIAEHARRRQYALQVIAVPKTIDNDLPYMDHTPGYGSAATFIAGTTQEAGRDTEAMQRVDPVKVIEVMGRNSGWLVAAAALGKRCIHDAPHLLYFPERPFCEQQFLDDVASVHKRVGYVVVVISETIKDKDNKRIGERADGITQDFFGHQYVEGTAAKLCSLVEKQLGMRARYDKPGTILRMSMNYISPVDQREAHMVGQAAVTLALSGKSEVMVTLKRTSRKPYRCTTGYIAVKKIAGVERYLPSSYINTRGNFVTPAFINYARPLVGILPSFIRL